MAEESIRIYIGGCSGIKNPVDANGKQITVGSKLTWNFHDDYYKGKPVADWMKKPIFIVKEHDSGEGLCAVGIDKDLYLHDFKFEYCEAVE